MRKISDTELNGASNRENQSILSLSLVHSRGFITTILMTTTTTFNVNIFQRSREREREKERKKRERKKLMMITKQAACEENVFNALENAVTSLLFLFLLRLLLLRLKSENEQIIGLTKVFLSKTILTSRKKSSFSSSELMF